jgi:serine/threonine-protein kinase
MASVWLARQHGKHGFEKLVAVKTILPLFAQDLRFQQMFLDEARIASGIEHPNVAQILDLGEEKDVLYIAMEWVDGDSLSKLFRAAEKTGNRLPVSIVCRIVSDACAGLHAAHELHDKSGELLNVVHRDVSPQNILVSTKGQAKLIDFGIAKARDRVAGDTSTGFLKGKILYMAPEQALGKPVDRRADVWAVGAVLYHMLAGVPPFEGANQLATLHLLTQEGGPPPLPQHVPPQVADVVWRALTKDHAKRIATAEDLQRALEAAMHASGQTAIVADVASFVNKQLVDRVEARRKAMDLALEAAKQRAKLQQMLKPSDADSASGIGQAFRTRSAQTPSDARIGAISSPETNDPTSSATLNSAAIVSARPSIVPRTRNAIVIGVLATCALVGAMAVGVAIAGRGRHESTAVTSSPLPPQPTQTQTALRTDIPKPPAMTAAPPPTTTVTAAVPVTAAATTAQQPVTTAKPHVESTATVARPKATASSKATNSTKTVDDGF